MWGFDCQFHSLCIWSPAPRAMQSLSGLSWLSMSSLALTGTEPLLDRCLHGVSGLGGFPPDGELSLDPLLCDIGHRWRCMSCLGVFLSWAGVLECWDTRELLALLEKVLLGWIYYTIKLIWGVTTRGPLG